MTINMNWSSSRTTEAVVGLYLIVLGIGLMIPRTGLGLYSIVHAGGDWQIWFVLMIGCGAGLVVAAWINNAGARLSSIAGGMLVWLALQAKFLEASLWGASLQALVSIGLLFACLISTVRGIKTDVPRQLTKGKH